MQLKHVMDSFTGDSEFTGEYIKRTDGQNPCFPELSVSALLEILESAQLGNWTLNLRNGMIHGCSRFKAILGTESLANDYKLILGHIEKRFQNAFKKAIKNTMNDEALYTEIALVSGNGNDLKWAKISGRLKVSTDGQSRSIVGLIEDITESKNREQAKNDMISYLNHELRTPLTSLRLYVQRTARSADEGGHKLISSLMGKADQQISSMQTMAENYLDFSAIENGMLKLDIENLGFNDLLENILEDYRLQFPGYVFELLFSGPIRVYADRAKVTQVMHNLLSNAVKYSPIPGTITVECIDQQRSVIVCIRDQGIGIAPRDLKNIFKRFSRFTTPGLPKIKGYGIGLHLVKSIISAHNGQLGVTSGCDVGSEFYFTLPMVREGSTSETQ